MLPGTFSSEDVTHSACSHEDRNSEMTVVKISHCINYMTYAHEARVNGNPNSDSGD